MKRMLALAASTFLLLAGCSGDSDSGDVDGSTSTSAAATTTIATDTSTSTEGPGSSTSTSVAAGGGDPAPDPSDLPGEAIEIYPYEGAELSVVGVAHDDVLNVRVGPGTRFAILEELAPTATGLTATGHNRTVDDGFWTEVIIDGSTGWVNGGFVLQFGATDDITATLDPLPSGETMIAVAELVAAQRASEEPRSRITIVTEPTVGDLGEVTVDVIGFGDDAVGGERLHVFATPAEGGEGFTVKSVEKTPLCSRGVSEGSCL